MRHTVGVQLVGLMVNSAFDLCGFILTGLPKKYEATIINGDIVYCLPIPAAKEILKQHENTNFGVGISGELRSRNSCKLSDLPVYDVNFNLLSNNVIMLGVSHGTDRNIRRVRVYLPAIDKVKELGLDSFLELCKYTRPENFVVTHKEGRICVQGRKGSKLSDFIEQFEKSADFCCV